eukprot:SAG22_NODE_880_length_6703_cov_8.753786_8_plen_236_part_00
MRFHNNRCVNGRIEKWCLRKAFDTPDNPYLPQEVLWRQKEQFSDGVGYNWIDSLREIAMEKVSDAQMKAAKHRFPYFPPATKEAYLYREIFEEHYPSETAAKLVPAQASVACSTSKAIEWDEKFKQIMALNGEVRQTVRELSLLAEGPLLVWPCGPCCAACSLTAAADFALPAWLPVLSCLPACDPCHQCSGRSVQGIHDHAYEDLAAEVSGKVAASRNAAKPKVEPSPKKQRRS